MSRAASPSWAPTAAWLSKYSAALYSTAPRPWTEWDDTGVQAEPDAAAGPDLAVEPEGVARVETYTVVYGRSGAKGVVIARLSDGSREIATTVGGDTIDALVAENPFGRELHIAAKGAHSYAALDRATAEAAAAM